MDTLTPAPIQGDPAQQAEESAFRHLAAQAIEETTGPEALETISRLHVGELNAVREKLRCLESELMAALSETRRCRGMAGQMAVRVASEIELSTRVHLQAQHSAAQLLAVSALVQAVNADDGMVPVESLRAILEATPESAPERPAVLAFEPSQDYTYGTFSDRSGSRVHLPFVGWSQVLTGPGALCLEATYQIGDHLKPTALLDYENGLSWLSSS